MLVGQALERRDPPGLGPWSRVVLDRFADRAALVELANAPDVFRDHAEHALGREPVPGEIRPVLRSVG